MKNLEILLEKYEITYDSKALTSFGKYINLLQKQAQLFNLTSITAKEDVYIKHFLDSVLPENSIPLGAKLIDLGSGAGFPALPLKILRPDLDCTLIEATEKKVSFLNLLLETLNLSDVKVIQGRAEVLAHDANFRELFDVCTARALAPLNVLCELTSSFLKVGGVLIAYKSKEFQTELDLAKNAIALQNLNLQKTEYIDLEGNDRALLFLKKTKPLESKYPRRYKKIRTKPL